MERSEFCKLYWNYYMGLEADFVSTERFVSFDLGTNNLYGQNEDEVEKGNSMTYSIEYVRQIQAICSEIDVLLKEICKTINEDERAENMKEYSSMVLSDIFWRKITCQKIDFRRTELQPFKNWKSGEDYQAPEWWLGYNAVKHNRIENYKRANLKNVVNALAGLFILENYFVKKITEGTEENDVPDDMSQIFKMKDWETKRVVIGKDFYAEV